MSLTLPIANRLPTDGLFVRAARRVILRPFDDAIDARLPSETSTKVPARRLAADTPSARHACEYAPTAGRLFQAMITSLPSDLRNFTFLDYGSGKGRVLCLAAHYPFRAVVGVEFSQPLHRQSLQNVAAARQWPDRRCGGLTAVWDDALAWPIPSGPCVFYLYNPFDAPVVEGVLARIRASWTADPREMHVVDYNPVHRDLFEAADFLRPRRPSALCRAALTLAPHELALFQTR